ncbi:histidine acid phosphatase [Opisthorchis viverrini]|uniref:acid phosphatase n=1 Tax=Opisthorchis viverrini TaxID=6198 RepID=A0A1S8WGF3_OPIVI|nr:histidine acid phosphatase [Opisthorchis viverrini]
MSSCLSYLILTLLVAPLRSDKTLETADPKPILVFILVRHGDRTPVHKLPNDPHKNLWTQGYGELTQYGSEQLRFLGKFIRQSYPDLLSTTYLPASSFDESFFRSSATNRTLMSAYSFIRGLYDQESTTVGYPPVYSIPLDIDHLLKMSSNCTQFITSYQNFMESPEVTLLAEQFSETLNHFQQRFCNRAPWPQLSDALYLNAKCFVNFNSFSLAQIAVMFPENPTPVGRLRVGWKICDPVGVWVLHQLPWPHWLTSEIAQQCARMLDFKHYIRFSTPALTRLRGGPLVAHMLRLFRTRANLELSRSSSAEQKKLAKPLPLVAPTSGLEVVGSGQRLIAYFAHDSTLAAVLSHLGIFNRYIALFHSHKRKEVAAILCDLMPAFQ